jgi:uncharacterized protein (DUF885 family)
MRAVFEQLGYSPDNPLSTSLNRAISDGGFLATTSPTGRDQAIAYMEGLISDIELQLPDAFNISPGTSVQVVGHPEYAGGGYYVPGTLDGSRSGAFHAGVGGPGLNRYTLPSLTYHEAVPGHHFQITIAAQQGLPDFRGLVHFNAYVEGWALYAERLAWDLGLYADDPYGNIGRLQFEMLRAVRLVTDTGIHAFGWTRSEAKQYMRDVLEDRFAAEVDRYIVLPAQALGYKMGMLKILELRDLSESTLGERFDLSEFHDVVLANGSMPLGILEQVVEDYITDIQASG